MSKNSTILAIGIIQLIMPLLGFPSTWRSFFSVVFGIILIVLSFSVAIKRRSSVRKSVRRKKEASSPIFIDGLNRRTGDTKTFAQASPAETEDSSVDDFLNVKV